MRCDASWRGGESCFSPCSPARGGGGDACVCVPLPLLICCLFCFLSVRFGKVQISALTAQCSKRKGEKQKGWRRGGDGGEEEAQPPAAGPGQAGGEWGWVPQAGFALRTRGVWWPLSPGVPRVASAASARMCRSSTMLLFWLSLVGEEGWKNKVCSSSCKMWAEALGENQRGSQLFICSPEMLRFASHAPGCWRSHSTLGMWEKSRI